MKVFLIVGLNSGIHSGDRVSVDVEDLMPAIRARANELNYVGPDSVLYEIVGIECEIFKQDKPEGE